MRKSTVSRMSSVSTERYSSVAVRQGNSEVKANQPIAEHSDTDTDTFTAIASKMDDETLALFLRKAIHTPKYML